MKRSAVSGLVLTAVLLAVPSAAAAKEIRGMRICGADACAKVPHVEAQRYHDVGGMAGVPYGARSARGPFYRLVFAIGEGDERSVGRFVNVYLPGPRLVAPIEGATRGEWMQLGDLAARRIDRLAAGLRPLPAGRLPTTRAASGSLPPEVIEVPQSDEADSGFPRPLIAGVPAAALLLGAGLVAVRRRRRR